MTKFVGLLAVLYLLCFPVRISTAQSDSLALKPSAILSSSKDQSPKDKKVAAIREEISNNLDSIKAFVKENNKPAPRVVVKKKYYRHVVRDTVYIDTCFEKPAQVIEVPAPVELPPPDTLSPQKIKWYQKIFHKKKNHQSKIPLFF